MITDVPGFGVLLPEDLWPVPRGVLSQNEILVNWTGFAATHEAAMYLGLDRARNMDQWEAGPSGWRGSGQPHRRRPELDSLPRARQHPRPRCRRPTSAPWTLMSGNDPRTLWTGGHLSEDDQPSARDPDRGYLTTANNDPWGFTRGRPRR